MTRRSSHGLRPGLFLVGFALFLVAAATLFGGGSSERSAPAGGAAGASSESGGATSDGAAAAVNPPLEVDFITEEQALRRGLAVATFAGGCFWCMEPPYDKLDGVISTTSGYSGGHVVNPRYEEVITGTTGHAEVVQIVFDPTVVTYEQLLDVFWVNIDPLDAGGQFCDRGTEYRSEIFFHTPEQQAAAEASRDRINASGVLPGHTVTQITPLEAFYPAEEYHQDYYLKNPLRYLLYRTSCGRDARLAQLWGSTQ
ncbi:MAG: peptide-methionine (S)-S-oxide reductase [Spirochaetaceae bacterium]|nr:MAG: peptide-methionine (S)-S-oxide reductase [Spirochaetaceae bacterium]